MENVEFISKWNLADNVWEHTANYNLRKKAFSIVSCGEIKNNESDDFEYIIVADGTRLENHSKSIKFAKNDLVMSNIINFYRNKKGNYKFKLILLDNDAPLREESKWIANYLDLLTYDKLVTNISYIGISKCGVMAFDLIKYIRLKETLDKLSVFSISSPYEGTIMASPLYLKKELFKILEVRISSPALRKVIFDSLMLFLERISSNSHMDYDIGIPGGVEDLSKYDPEFIKRIFEQRNILAAKSVCKYQNICTVIREETLKNIIDERSAVGLGVYLLNKYLFNGESDGLVLLSSQRKMDNYINDSSVTIASVHNPFQIKYFADKTMDIIWKTQSERLTLKR